jgi:hypothetical protein
MVNCNVDDSEEEEEEIENKNASRVLTQVSKTNMRCTSSVGGMVATSC